MILSTHHVLWYSPSSLSLKIEGLLNDSCVYRQDRYAPVTTAACIGRTQQTTAACIGRTQQTTAACIGRTQQTTAACKGRTQRTTAACIGRTQRTTAACLGRTHMHQLFRWAIQVHVDGACCSSSNDSCK